MALNRRDFVKKSLTAASGLAAASLAATPLSASILGADKPDGAAAGTARGAFRLKYAPGLGMFSALGGKEIPGYLDFCKNEGFRAVFDNNFPNRPVDEQDRIASALAARGMDFGPYVLYTDFGKATLVHPLAENKALLEEKAQVALNIAKRTGFKKALLVPGCSDPNMFSGYQTANVVENLRYMCGLLEEAGVVLVLEPLNRVNHPKLFLTRMDQAYFICRAVNSPSCKIVNDLYHQQITEGNLIYNLKAAWSEIGGLHVGDNPGRNEPGSGEINYRNVFKFLHEQGWDQPICMEHGKSLKGAEGERKVIEAYRQADAF